MTGTPDDDERWAERRIQYLETTHDLPGTRAKVVAFAELGYSSSGIAKKIGVGESTVNDHFRELSKEWSAAVIYPRTEGFDVEVDLEDRSVHLDPKCPECGSRKIVSREGMSGVPNLPALRNDSGDVFPLSPGGKMMVPGTGELVPAFDGEEVDMREKFLESDYERICVWCFWMGFRGALP